MSGKPPLPPKPKPPAAAARPTAATPARPAAAAAPPFKKPPPPQPPTTMQATLKPPQVIPLKPPPAHMYRQQQPHPPQPLKYRHNHHRRRRGSPCSCRRACCLATGLLLLALCLALAASCLAYLYYRPRAPSFHLQPLRPVRLRLGGNGNNASSSYPAAIDDATVGVKVVSWNPNERVALRYGAGEGRVALADADGDVDLGWAPVPGFDHAPRTVATVAFVAAARGLCSTTPSPRACATGTGAGSWRSGCWWTHTSACASGGCAPACCPSGWPATAASWRRAGAVAPMASGWGP